MTRPAGRRKGSHLEQAEKTRAEVAALGLTLRQVEYWTEKGWIIPDGNPAQGRPRVFSAPEMKVLRTMARLAHAGFPARVAAQVARRAVTVSWPDGDEVAVELAGGGLLLVIRDI